MFAAFVITQAQGIILVLAVLVGLFALAWLGRANQKLILLRKRAQDLGAFNNEIGLKEAADFFEDFAVNDVDGMWESAQAMLKIAENPALRATTLATVVDKYIIIAKQANNTAEITRLQGLLAGTAAADIAAGQTGLDVKGLVSALAAQATLPPIQAQGGTTRIVHQPPSFQVQPPALQTDVSTTVVPPTGAATAAPAAK